MSIYGFFADDLTGASGRPGPGPHPRTERHARARPLVEHVRADAADVVGLARPRTLPLSGEALNTEIRTGLAAMQQLDPQVLLFTRSARPSTPQPTVGSIGRALELVAEVALPRPRAGASRRRHSPEFGRYTAFSQHFGVYGAPRPTGWTGTP